MTEPDVALTDYALAVECFVLARLLTSRLHGAGVGRRWGGVFFLGIAVAALLGGTVHGFFAADVGPGGSLLWRSTLIAIGVAALACWVLGAQLLWRAAGVRRVLSLGAVLVPLHVVAVAFVSDSFFMALLAYVPGVLFLLAACVLVARRHPSSGAGRAVAGLALSLLAAVLQQLRVGAASLHLSHNAVYHLLQGIALVWIYSGIRDVFTMEASHLAAKRDRRTAGAPESER